MEPDSLLEPADPPLPLVRAACAGAVQWEVLPDWQPALLDPQGLKLADWLQAGQAHVIKDGAHRTVYRVDLPSQSFFLKHYRCRALGSIGRNLLKASPARRECVKALEVARRQIPTVRPLALGEACPHGLVQDNFLVTEAIPQACSLDAYVTQHLPQLPRPTAARLRRKLLLALAKLCAAAHSAGIDHDDFHTGNILVRLDTCVTDGPDLPQLHLIDLPGIRLGGPLSWARSKASLVMLSSDWFARTSRSERQRFWRTYLLERGDLALPDQRTAAAQIARQTRAYGQRLLRGRDKRVLRNNRDYYALRTTLAHGHAITELSPEQFIRLLDDPEAPLRRHGDRPVKLSHSSVVVEAELAVGGRALKVAYKRARVKSWWKSWLAFFRRSRALHGWMLGQALHERGIPTARPIAVCEPSRLRPRCDSYLATQWIDGAINLHLYAWALAKRPLAERTQRTRQTARNLGRTIGLLHAWQFSHRDLKACNLVAVEGPQSVATLLIDLDGARLHWRLSQRTQERNLARLACSFQAHPWLTRTDYLRFLRAYLKQQPQQRDWKSLWRTVSLQMRPVLARLQRAGQVA